MRSKVDETIARFQSAPDLRNLHAPLQTVLPGAHTTATQLLLITLAVRTSHWRHTGLDSTYPAMASLAKPHNAAAWALKPNSRPFVVSSAPYTSPPKGHVTIKVRSVAVDPIDWILQDQDFFGLKYPAILGLDIAGEIEEVGSGVDGFKVGQRVIA